VNLSSVEFGVKVKSLSFCISIIANMFWVWVLIIRHCCFNWDKDKIASANFGGYGFIILNMANMVWFSLLGIGLLRNHGFVFGIMYKIYEC